MMSFDKTWLSAQPLQPQSLTRALRSHFRTTGCDTDTRQLQCLDTFGHNLWFAGLLLYRQADTLTLCRGRQLLDDRPLATVRLDQHQDTPRFYWELPEGELKALLRPHLKLRALTPVADFHHRQQLLEVRNRDDKIVVRLHIDGFYPSANSRKAFYQILRAEALRGYHEELDAVASLLEQQLPLREIKPNPALAYFESLDKLPTPYSNKFQYRFDKSTPAREVLNGMILEALSIMRRNERGLIEDVDTEFLHDYRVALRKARSLLSQVKGVYPEAFTREVRATLSRLGRRTNRLRDLDVYLLERDNYFALPPPALAPGLKPMFDDFAAERAREHQALSRYLRGRSYRATIRKLQGQFSQQATLDTAPEADTPIYPLACKKIRKAYRKVCKRGRRIGPETPDEEVHQLRIDCKKLRYLLEFFAPAFDRKAVNALVRHLKTLQDTLGRFNDLAVQQASLQDYLARKNTNAAELNLAIGALLGIMYQEQLAIHDRVADQFAAFDDEQTRERFAQLFPKAAELPEPERAP